ncbi:enterochelin esterase-like enzyme [Arcanobacterium pluranimalium]|uniref:alpha/beta hydrolase n=1 Tax=Arcanobacterium pluranimalium TaxID=108028 RepID=UPI00195CDC9D|nr:alpha/beta hydrolase-fold protein [Arcanobacterium pluranimalium]MBM7824582.1 enterochelin esterase-like enzyme [Arcanobacterium pluranimalium]
MHFFELVDNSTLAVSIILFIVALLWTTIGLPLLWKKRLAPQEERRKDLISLLRWIGIKFVPHLLSVILCCVLAVWSAFVGFNRSTLWYATWDDLFGQLDQQVQVQDIGGDTTGDTKADSKGDGSASSSKNSEKTKPAKPQFSDLQRNPLSNPALTGIQDATQGQWIKVNIDGQGQGGDGTTYIHLPASYTKSSDRVYPVIVAFQGVPGSPAGFTEIMHTAEKYQQVVDKGEMGEAIIVAPTVFPRNLDTECRDVPGASIETWVTTTLRTWIQTNLRTVDSRDAWVTDGYSAGGWCAAMFAMRHTDIFGGGIVRSGYFAPQYTKGVVWDDPNNPAYTLSEVAKGGPDSKLFVVVGKKDGDKRASYDTFKKSVKAPTTVTEFEVGGSSHRWDVWVDSQPPSYTWLGKTLAGFAPKK